MKTVDLSEGCSCKRASHTHGQYATYVHHGCRCTDCREANNQLTRDRTRQKAYGRYRFVDATPVREHVQALMNQGMGYARIGRAAGVHNSTMTYLIHGFGGADPRPPKKKIDRLTAEAILNVELDLAPGAKVPAIGSRRRLEALMWNGWSGSSLAHRLGVEPANLFYFRGTTTVTQATHDAVVALFDELWDVAPPCATHREKISVARTKRLARERNFAPPAAWDDLDDPAESPTLGVAGRATLDPSEAIWLLTNGVAPIEAASRLGVRLGSLAKALTRAGHPEYANACYRAASADRRVAA